jgi:N-acetylmuramoyl-L-alanine amidase
MGASTDAPSKVTAVRFWSLGEVTRVAIEVSSDFHYKSDRLSNPDRLFFDIHGAKPELVSKGMHVIQVGDAIVKQIRVAETQPGVTRVVLDLEKPAEFTASQLSTPNRLMLELRLKDRPAPPATSTTRVQSLKDTPARPAEADMSTAAPVPSSAPPPKKEIRTEAAPESRVETSPEPPRPQLLRRQEAAVQPELDASVRPHSVESRDQPRVQPRVQPRNFEPPPERAQPARIEPPPPLLSQPSATLVARTMRVSWPGPPMALANAKRIPPPPAALRDLDLPKPAARSEAGPEPLPARRNANGDRSLTRVLGLKLGRVVIDPGHGGHDVGTHGPSGLYEKDVVLDIAKRLGTLLEDGLGSDVVFTRTDDTYVALEERTRIANDRKADLFLSIHANSSPYRLVAGVETYYLNFTTSKTALDVATRENASSERSVFDLKDLLQKIALKDKIDESREFATRIEAALYGVSSKSNPNAKNRGVKKAPFVVLIGASMPSVLAEIGFLTNAGDEALLKKAEHRQKIAEALYKGIAAYAESLSRFQVAARD